MFSRVVLHIFVLVLTVHSVPAQAKVVIECDRPDTIVFDESKAPELEAVIASNELLKSYSVEAKAYIECLQKVIISERDEILATIKSYRKKNADFRDAYINK
ncbi:MAG: hypothetical protein KTR18_14465 [Acidiferrobacterales bacterium]|nr:hypothetical protein [Acidiferrobacterales bacterium]